MFWYHENSMPEESSSSNFTEKETEAWKKSGYLLRLFHSELWHAKTGPFERYTDLNAEFQRIARRDKKAFLSDQSKKIEGKNRMGKTRDLFKKIRDTKGNFHAKMGTIKDRNGMDLTEAEDIKKRW